MLIAQFDELLPWLTGFLGPIELLSDRSRMHPGERASTLYLRAASGNCYLKTYPQRADWETEVHAYEQWARAFGDHAPRLLAVRDVEPLGLVISELEGTALEETRLSVNQERAVWRRAGEALRPLHELADGEFFGPCLRDGSPASKPVYEAREYVTAELEDWLRRGTRLGCLNDGELAIIKHARSLIPSFEGEKPCPCHRDYCPPNWLVTENGDWAGVIDFEFAYWDVRVADFTRYPSWEWIDRPDLMESFFEGYGRSLTPQEEEQRRFSHVLYALGAIVWGSENVYHGFAREGRRSLEWLGRNSNVQREDP